MPVLHGDRRLRPRGRSPVTLAFFERLGSADKTLRLYPEMLHEPLNEIGREEVVKEMTGWLNRQLERVPGPLSPRGRGIG